MEGLSRDGGLYLPESIPQLTLADIRALARLSYPERAAKIMKLYLEEFSEEELLGFAQKAYGPAKFDTPAAAPVVQLADNTYIQELWHGPTCAFKDMALQMLPYLLTASLKKDRRGEDRLHPRRHLRRHRQGRARGLPGRGPHEDPRLLPPTAACRRSRSSRWSRRRAGTSACAPCAATLTTRRPASSASSPMRSCARRSPPAAISSPRPTPSTGAGSCRRSCITSRRTATCSPPAPSRKDRPSTSACRRATSATSSPASTRRRWACPSAGSSARRTRITS